MSRSFAALPPVLASVAILFGLAGAVGCKATEVPEPQSNAVCQALVAKPSATAAGAQSLTPELWTSILLRNYDRSTQTSRGPAVDCSGLAVAETKLPTIETCEEQPAQYPQDPIASGEALAIEAPLADGQFLLWTPVTANAHGDGLGPIAYGQWTERGVEVLALGQASAHLNRASMRLESIERAPILVIESDRCDAENTVCAREFRLLVVRGKSIVDLPVYADNGGCPRHAKWQVNRVHEVDLSSSVRRKFTLTTSIKDGPDGPTIQEHIEVTDHDKVAKDMPPQVFRQADLDRPLRIERDRLVIRPSLWGPMLEQHGSVRPEEAAGPQ